MYTIFKNDQRIILTDELNSINREKYKLWSDLRGQELLDSDLLKSEREVSFYCKDLAKAWQEFASNFTIIEAGGGIVRNSYGHILMIFRNEKWDLPKGKIEKGESKKQGALREVEEECGVKDLELGRFVETTYHIYELQEEMILKVSHWYEMKSNQKQFKPQTEEGITEVSWFEKKNLAVVFENTYPNIVLLLKLFI